jgi:hypothetical protein
MRKLCAFLMVFLGLMVSCSSSSKGESDGVPSNVSCAQSATGCRCSATPFSLDSDESPVESCDSPGTGVACCHDLDSNGKTSECECQSYVCTQAGNSCECHWRRDDPGSSVLAASSCANDHAGSTTYPYAGICCDSDTYCNCGGKTTASEVVTCANGTETSSCGGSGATRVCTYFGSNNLAGHPAGSCAGLDWKS